MTKCTSGWWYSKSYGNLGDPARGQADLLVRSAAVYTMDQLGTSSDMGSAVVLPDPVHKKFEMYFCVLLRVYRLVFITVMMYNPL